ncbi:ParB N-terminal domain-containing protein [Faecousia sp.]|uniref:ParB N-terminal domain-containing protein n=1 Tax=Faecousia sp. TaxID=2952921 RepID=UPI002A9C5551|nr:ParB N-terminal domain-containing protein [Candidatus Faecousia sp.]
MEIVNQIVMRKISEVRPYVRNPRKNDKTVNLLVEIIPKVGFNVPLVIDRAGVIVKGHARYAAAIRLGMQEIPCVVTDADEETIKLDRLADNRISEFSEWIDEDLLHEVDMLNLDFDFDLDALGFSVPSDSFAEDFFESDMGGTQGESDSDRRARYAAYLESAAKEEAANAAIVTQEQLNKAKASAVAVAEKPPKYFKVVCEQCGKVMFIKEGDAVFATM